MTHENILNLSIEDRIEIIRNCMKQIEISMSKESQLSLTSYLKENKDTILHNSKSMCIITHSEFLVKELESIYTFLNMNEYKTVNE